MRQKTTLINIKLLHTVAWLFFVACIFLLPYFAYIGNFKIALTLILFVSLEVIVLAVNRWRCPLTAVAARHTSDRQANFDIYLPLWLAKYNKEIFGPLFIAGLAYTIFEWCLNTYGA